MAFIDNLRWGLRTKSLVALTLILGLALCFAFLAGDFALDMMRKELGSSFVKSHVSLLKERVRTKVLPELTLTRQLAQSSVTHRWLADEENLRLRAEFFEEAETYRRSFADRSYAAISAKSKAYYQNSANQTYSEAPRYFVNPDRAADEWFFLTLKQKEEYSFNVDGTSPTLKRTLIWINVLARDKAGTAMGVVSTGLDLTDFLAQFVHTKEKGILPIFMSPEGAIQAHPDPSLISYVAMRGIDPSKTIYALLDREDERNALRATLSNSALQTDKYPVTVVSAMMQGKPRLLGISYVPELKWFAVSVIDLQQAGVLDGDTLAGLASAGLVVALVLVLLTQLGFDQLVLSPLLRLTRTVSQCVDGNYSVALHTSRKDELGDLTRSFDTMVTSVREHTEALETKVAERTADLSLAHAKIEEAHHELTDSIRYASFYQSALLPDMTISNVNPNASFVVWKPRDVVGGDLYFMRPTAEGCFIGLVDCAGHGVPGAFMTMIAYAALDTSLAMIGPKDPAALLTRFDDTVRSILPRARFGQITTDMDMALCYVDYAQQNVVYAGAKLPLYWVDQTGEGQAKPSRRNIAGQRKGEFENQTLEAVPGRLFYLSSDGFLDQAGGSEGFGLGTTRFTACLRAHAQLPLLAQKSALENLLSQWKGDLPQRDDVTVLGFCPSLFVSPDILKG